MKKHDLDMFPSAVWLLVRLKITSTAATDKVGAKKQSGEPT